MGLLRKSFVLRVLGLTLAFAPIKSSGFVNSDSGIVGSYREDSLMQKDLRWKPSELSYRFDEKNGRFEFVRNEDSLWSHDMVWRPDEQVYHLDENSGKISKGIRKDFLFRDAR